MLLKRGHAAHDFELNLTPIIDCFVTLICFLLLSATYVNLVGMEAKVPVVVRTTGAQEEAKPKFKLELNARANGLELVASGAGGISGKRRVGLSPSAAGGSRYDLVSLHNELVKIKRQYPKEFSIHFSAQVEMAYEELIRIMDTTRNLANADGTFTITDERNGNTLKVDTLFPDFVIANLGQENH